MADDVLGEMAAAVGVAPLTSEEQRLLLDCTRDVAHATERRLAPLSAFLLGAAVGGAAGRPVQLEQQISQLLSVLTLGDAEDPPAG